MNPAAWTLLAERSRALVHQASLLMGALTRPTGQEDDATLAPTAMSTASATEALMTALAASPELAAHLRTLQRFDVTLGAWRRSVGEASPFAHRYQVALMQQAAQVVISCLHVEGLAASESARVDLSRHDVPVRPYPGER